MEESLVEKRRTKMGKTKILFLCVHNSARSQMAEGFLRHLYGDKYDVYSAGVTPTKVNPYAIKAMAEVGIDISDYISKSWRSFGIEFGFDTVISTCSEAEQACPSWSIGKRLHWEFPDPAEAEGTEEEIMDVFRGVRDSIRDRIASAVKNKEI
jgi:arsenate reductase